MRFAAVRRPRTRSPRCPAATTSWSAPGETDRSGQPAEAMGFLAGLGVDAVRLRAMGGPAGVARLKAEGARADCEVGADRRAALGCRRGPARGPDSSSASTASVCELATGADVAEAARFAAVGYAAVMFDTVGGAEAAEQAWSLVRAGAGSGDRGGFRGRAGRAAGGVQPCRPVGGRGRRRACTAARVSRRGRSGRSPGWFRDAADLKSPLFTGHARGLPGWRARPPIWSPAVAQTVDRAGLCTTSAGSPCLLASGSGPGSCGPMNGNWCGCIRTTPAGSWPGRRARAAGLIDPGIMNAWTGPGTRPAWACPSGHRVLPAGRGRRVPRALRAAAAPGPAGPGRGRRIMSGLPLDRDEVRARSTPPARGARPARAPGWPDRTGTRETAASRRGQHETSYRRRAGDLAVAVDTHTAHIYAERRSTRAGLAMFAIGTVSRPGPGRPPPRSTNSR